MYFEDVPKYLSWINPLIEIDMLAHKIVQRMPIKGADRKILHQWKKGLLLTSEFDKFAYKGVEP